MKMIKPLILTIPLLLLVSCDKGKDSSGSTSTTATTATDAAAKPYPLDVCLVSDEKLGAMGDPVSIVYKGQEFKLCCEDCIDTFNKDPDKYLAMLKEKTDDEPAQQNY